MLTKLGTTRAGPRTRVWLEGARLTEASFYVGRYFLKQWDAGLLTIISCTADKYHATPRAERGKVSGVAGRPIIDITGAIVASTFKGAHVRVTYAPDRITVSNE